MNDDRNMWPLAIMLIIAVNCLFPVLPVLCFAVFGMMCETLVAIFGRKDPSNGKEKELDCSSHEK